MTLDDPRAVLDAGGITIGDDTVVAEPEETTWHPG